MLTRSHAKIRSRSFESLAYSGRKNENGTMAWKQSRDMLATVEIHEAEEADVNSDVEEESSDMDTSVKADEEAEPSDLSSSDELKLEDYPQMNVEDFNSGSETSVATHSSVTSQVSDFMNKFGGNRRASVAVWADDKLSKMVQNIKQRDHGAIAPQRSLHFGLSFVMDDDVSDIAQKADGEGTTLDELENVVIAQILALIPLKQRFQLRSLSKKMTRVFITIPSLVQDLDFSELHKLVTDDTILNLAALYGSNFVSLNLKGCWAVADKGLQAISQYAPNIQVINLSGCWDITDAGLSAIATYCVNLRKIDLSNCRKISDLSVLTLLKHCRKLQDLSFSYCKNLTGGIFFDMELWTDVQRLNLQRCTGIFDEGFSKWAGHTLAMNELNLTDCSFLTDSTVESISESCRDLQTLCLSFCCALTEESILNLVSGCPKLSILDLSFCGTAVTDGAIHSLADGLPEITRLSLRGCVQISDTGALSLLTHAKNLAVINITNCKNISKPVQAAMKGKYKLFETQSVVPDTNVLGFETPARRKTAC